MAENECRVEFARLTFAKALCDCICRLTGLGTDDQPARGEIELCGISETSGACQAQCKSFPCPISGARTMAQVYLAALCEHILVLLLQVLAKRALTRPTAI